MTGSHANAQSAVAFQTDPANLDYKVVKTDIHGPSLSQEQSQERALSVAFENQNILDELNVTTHFSKHEAMNIRGKTGRGFSAVASRPLAEGEFAGVKTSLNFDAGVAKDERSAYVKTGLSIRANF